MKKIAVIGLGNATRNIHLPAYARLKNKITLVGGCDIDENNRKSVAENFSQTFDNLEEMIEKTQPDIVSICTPPFVHLEHCLVALNKKCHVFCEKPIAENMDDIDKIISASEREQRFVVVNSEFPYMNIHTAAKSMIDSHNFGKLQFLHAWQTFTTTQKTEAGWRGKMKRRLCFEFGVHVFELIRFFFDAQPQKVYCHIPEHNGTEAVNIISVEFPDGRAASAVLDRLSKGPERYLDIRLNGERASIHTSIGGEVCFETGIHTREKIPFIKFNFVKGGKALLQKGNKSKIIAKDPINPFAHATFLHFSQFIEAIENKKRPHGTIQDHQKTMALVFAAYKSAELKKVIELY